MILRWSHAGTLSLSLSPSPPLSFSSFLRPPFTSLMLRGSPCRWTATSFVERRSRERSWAALSRSQLADCLRYCHRPRSRLRPRSRSPRCRGELHPGAIGTPRARQRFEFAEITRTRTRTHARSRTHARGASQMCSDSNSAAGIASDICPGCSVCAWLATPSKHPSGLPSRDTKPRKYRRHRRAFGFN